jgi:hypothetical protein
VDREVASFSLKLLAPVSLTFGCRPPISLQGKTLDTKRARWKIHCRSGVPNYGRRAVGREGNVHVGYISSVIRVYDHYYLQWYIYFATIDFLCFLRSVVLALSLCTMHVHWRMHRLTITASSMTYVSVLETWDRSTHFSDTERTTNSCTLARLLVISYTWASQVLSGTVLWNWFLQMLFA